MSKHSTQVFSTREYIIPRIFRNTLPKFFQNYMQHDCSEFSKILIEKLESEEGKTDDVKKLLINKYLMGKSE